MRRRLTHPASIGFWTQYFTIAIADAGPKFIPRNGATSNAAARSFHEKPMSSALDGFEPPTRRLFQPLHIGHQFMIDQTLERAENGIVLIGSDSAGRSPRNL